MLVVQGVAAKDVVTTLENGLKSAGYTTDALSGPLEDGSFILEMNGSQAGCQVQVTASPTGGLTDDQDPLRSGLPERLTARRRSSAVLAAHQRLTWMYAGARPEVSPVR